MVNLKEMIGTFVFSPNGNYIVGVSDKQNEEFQQKCQNIRSMIDMDLLREKIRNGDSVELKGVSSRVLSSENYNDILKVTKMPKSIFGDAFGYQMQKDIADCMRQYYAGKISDDDVKNFFKECCSSMRVYHSQLRHTTGMNEEDNMQIVSEIYEMFAKENQRAARNANYEEGLEINRQYGADKRQDDWCYYSADYYYQCESTHDFLRGAAADMAAEWELPAIDTDEIERNSKYTLDGGFDFNSGWNFTYRNQVGRSSMADESSVPPKDFKFFYKEGMYPDTSIDKGLLRVWIGNKEYTRKVPFEISRTGLKGQIFNAGDLLKNALSNAESYREYGKFLSNFSIFTRWYSFKSGINNRFGNYVPDYV